MSLFMHRFICAHKSLYMHACTLKKILMLILLMYVLSAVCRSVFLAICPFWKLFPLSLCHRTPSVVCTTDKNRCLCVQTSDSHSVQFLMKRAATAALLWPGCKEDGVRCSVWSVYSVYTGGIRDKGYCGWMVGGGRCVLRLLLPSPSLSPWFKMKVFRLCRIGFCMVALSLGTIPMFPHLHPVHSLHIPRSAPLFTKHIAESEARPAWLCNYGMEFSAGCMYYGYWVAIYMYVHVSA